ncbi:hypothetical protein APSETT445_004093 [Aspergillus pseudonomiae]
MSSDMRQASGNSKAKRRLIDADDDNRSNTAADEHTSNPKRQRVSRACDSCRSKKDKCDGVQPVCSTCASLSRPCTYKANPKKRGLPTGYIRTLELLWGLVFCKIKGSEDVVRALLKAANMPSHLSTMGKEAEGSDTLLFSWKNSAVLRDVERMLTLLEQPEDEQDKELRAPGDSDSPQDAEGSSVLSSDTLECLIPGEEGAYDIGHVQALLILSLIKLGQQEWAAAWVLVGQAVRISQCLRLDRPPSTQLINEDGLKSPGRAKHVFLGCFLLETIVAMQTDQIPSLRKGDLMRIGPINEDGLEEWHPWEDQTGLRPVESSRGERHVGVTYDNNDTKCVIDVRNSATTKPDKSNLG